MPRPKRRRLRSKLLFPAAGEGCRPDLPKGDRAHAVRRPSRRTGEIRPARADLRRRPPRTRRLRPRPGPGPPSAVPAEAVTRSQWTRRIRLTVLLLHSAMETFAEARMAIAMARVG